MPALKWKIETCRKEALKYSSRNEFKKGSGGAYKAAYKEKWLDEICKHMTLFKTKGYWTLDICSKEALKYSSRSYFSKMCNGAYQKAYKEGWIDEICMHMTPIHKPKGYWTLETCKKEALEYSSRNEFKIGSSSAYNKARQEKWLDKICMHMIKEADGLHYMVYGIINERLMKAYVGITRRQFSQRISNHQNITNSTHSAEIALLSDTQFIKLTDYIYTNAELKGAEGFWAKDCENKGFQILNDQTKYGRVGVGKRIYSDEYIRQVAKKYISRNEFKKHDSCAYNYACRQQIVNAVCSHMSPKYKPDGYWTLETCKNEALKYSSRKELEKGSSSAYSKALKEGWIDEICMHMTPNHKPYGYWTLETCKNEALKYSSRNEFKKGSGGALNRARQEKWLDEICMHMN